MMDDYFMAPMVPEGGAGHGKRGTLGATFAPSLAAVLVALMAAAAKLVVYSDRGTDGHVEHYYMWFIHVAIMIFVGFGFLMTFLKRYSYSAVALNFVLSALVILEFIVIGGAVQQDIFGGDGDGKIELDLPLLIDAAFCAGSAMIAFGAVLGKATPSQITWLLVLLVPVYSVNQHLVFDRLRALDIGGSMTIHAFGAYYGLAASLFLSPKGSGGSHPKNRASYSSDVTAMIGTIFLFIFWPSFNGALSVDPSATATTSTALLGTGPLGSLESTMPLGALGASHHSAPANCKFHCVVNTVLSLCAACVATFAASAALGGRLNMVHIQNATLAGGVAIGSAASMALQPAGAMLVGAVAGLLSTLGYVFVTPALERGIGLKDTCGVHNLHGMPGVLGGVAAAVATVVVAQENRSLLTQGSLTWMYQVAALAATLVSAVVAGAIGGFAISRLTPASRRVSAGSMFEDSLVFDECEEEEGAHSYELGPSAGEPPARA